jgi:hypothetical protein
MNIGKAFQGSIVLGMGFTFDDISAESGGTESIATMHRLIEKDAINAERIFPFLGGEELANDPRHAHDRYIIDFEEMPKHRVAENWPELLEIVERRVRPDRKKQKRKDLSDRWWQFAYRKRRLYEAISKADFVLAVNCGASPHLAIARVAAQQVFAHSLVVFTDGRFENFCVLQSRPHELWTRFFASSMKDDLRYTPSDCFETFPFPVQFETNADLKLGGHLYHDHRAAFMIAHNEGMTKTYNRFRSHQDLRGHSAAAPPAHSHGPRRVGRLRLARPRRARRSDLPRRDQRG